MSWATASGRIGTANHCFEKGVKTRETVPALVRTVPGVGEGSPVPLDRDAEGGFDRRIAALGPARDVGVGVHRSRICLLGEGGQDADRVADADMESPAELGDRSVEGLRSGEERSAPVGPRSVEQRRFDHQRGDDLVVGFGGGGPGGIVLEAESRDGTRRWRWTSIRLRAVGGVRMLSAEMDCDDPLGVRARDDRLWKSHAIVGSTPRPGRGV